MDVFETIDSIRKYRIAIDQKNSAVAFVPTMGNLHKGHLSLVQKAQTMADRVVVSIYVNPTQFGVNEDFADYPRTRDADLALLKSAGVQAVFYPAYDELYPFGTDLFTSVSCPAFDRGLCSTSRPHFFTGVATVVTKLLNIVRPDFAIFGQKDFQQLLVIRRICEELFIEIKIISAPIVRSESGLALSSRNKYLSESELKIAPLIFKTLSQAKHDIETKPGKLQDSNYLASLEEHAKIALTEFGFKIDYFEILDSATLAKPVSSTIPNYHSLIIATACKLGNTRLIDNVLVEVQA